MIVLASKERIETAGAPAGATRGSSAGVRKGAWLRRQWPAAAQLGLALVLLGAAVTPPLEALADRDVRLHHLLHAAIIAAGALLGRLAAARWGHGARTAGADPASRARPAAWRWAVVSLGPLVLMAAMVPATSTFVDQHIGLHVAEHLGLLVAAAAIAAVGARLAPSVGWLVACSLPLMAALFAGLVAAQP